MPWVKVDDQFQDHPKFLDVSLTGVGLWLAGLAYCSRYLTDGRIPVSAARRLGATPKLTKELEHAGLWIPHPDGGWEVHDYLAYNPSASDTRDLREKRADAGRQGGQARGRQRQAEARAKQLAKQTGANGQGKPEAPDICSASSRPLKNLSTSVDPLSSSSRGVWGDDDDELATGSPAFRAGHAAHILAGRALQRRRNDLPDQRIHRPAAWLAQAAHDLEQLHGDQLRTLAEQGLTPKAIADAVDAAPEPTLPTRPRCAECGGEHLPIEGPCPYAVPEEAP